MLLSKANAVGSERASLAKGDGAFRPDVGQSASDPEELSGAALALSFLRFSGASLLCCSSGADPNSEIADSFFSKSGLTLSY